MSENLGGEGGGIGRGSGGPGRPPLAPSNTSMGAIFVQAYLYILGNNWPLATLL